MKVNFTDFVNEAKINEFYEGVRVKLQSTFYLYSYRIYQKINSFATCTRIEQGKWYKYYHFKLDEPIVINGKKVSKIELDSSQLKTVLIWNEKTEKLQNGELIKYNATARFNWVLRNSRFKRTEELVDIADIDLIDGDAEMVSYIPIQKNKMENKEKYRQKTRVGRILIKLNPRLSQTELEEAILSFRALAESYFNPIEIKVVTGKEISYWYSSKNYQKGGGSLNNSCMRHEVNQKQVEFYNHFTEQISLAILVKEDKLWARALIWKFDDGRIYMDRIYSVNSESMLQMKEFGIKHDMLLYNEKEKYNEPNIKLKGKVTLKNGWFYINSIPFFDSANIDFGEIKKIGTHKDIILKF